MRRSLFAVAVLCLTACSAPAEPTALDTGQSAAPSAAAPRERPTLRVLFAGDSLTEGYFATRARSGFPERLTRRWAQHADVAPLTVAVAGARTWRIADAVTEAAPAGLDLAILEAGANDAGHTPPRTFRRWYADLLAAVEADSPGVVVICLGPWESPAVTRRYEVAVERLCSGGQRHYAPLSDLFAVEELHGPSGSDTAFGARDHYHPNDRGHAAIAKRVSAAVAAAISG